MNMKRMLLVVCMLTTALTALAGRVFKIGFRKLTQILRKNTLNVL